MLSVEIILYSVYTDNMPRPQRLRRICRMPKNTAFSPDCPSDEESIVLSIDEYEVLRLVDLEEKTHEECAIQMDISRSTVQEIYESARRKTSAAIVFGRNLVISGGAYRICSGNEDGCCRRECIKDINLKGDNMKIAVTYDNGSIFQHFGHTEAFKLYTAENGKILSSEVISTDGSGHGALAGFLMRNGVDTLICGGIGGGAQIALREAGIKLYGGVSGNADKAVEDLLSGNLEFNPDVHCSHHDHGNSEHSCGHHSCH